MKKFINSLGYAVNGLRLFFSNEQNGQKQAIVSILVIVLGFALRLHTYEWIIILAFIALVLALEMMNSVIEKLIDHLHPQQHPNIKWVKDVAAGAVLWAAIISAIIGCVIFLPKMIGLISK